MKVRIAAEGKNSAAASRQLWSGLVRFNRITAGPLRYTRTVLTVRDAAGKIHGGLILQSYWKESYVELLWLSEPARRGGLGRKLMQEAERRASTKS